MTEARLQADAEALRVAELYASHPLLRRFPIPRFRLPEVEIDVPVVLSEADSVTDTDGPRRPGPSVDDIRRRFDDVLSEETRRAGVRLVEDDDRRLGDRLDRVTRSLRRPAAVNIDSAYIVDRLSHAAVQEIRRSNQPEIDVERIRILESALSPAAREAVIRVDARPRRLDALVRTSEVRAAGTDDGKDVVVRFRLKLVEEGFEWTTLETDDGEKDDSLVPE